MKKIILFFAFLFIQKISFSQCNPSFFDGFESGNYTPTWTQVGGTFSVLNSGSPVGTYHLSSTTNTGHLGGIYASFTASTPTSMSWYMKPTGTAAGNYVVTGNSAVTATNCISFCYNSSNTIRFVASSTYSYTIPTLGVWYKIEMRNINWIAHTFDIYIDNVLMSTAFPFRNATQNDVSRIHLYNFTAGAVGYWDQITLGNPPPTVNITSSPSTTLCFGDTINLSGNGALSYTWSGGVTNAVGFSPASSAIYTVTGTDATLCTGTSTVQVTVNPLPIVVANPAIVTVCGGGQTTLFGSGAATYTWSGGVTDNVPYTFSTSGIYTVTGTDINNCSNTATSSVSLFPANTSTSVTPATVFNCIGGASTLLTASGSVGNYTWDPGAITGNPVNVSPAFFTTYTVTGVDANGCTGTATANVIVTNPTGELANATVNNASSVMGNNCNNVSHADGINLGYFDANCKLIANVIDAPGGNILGNVNTCVTVDASVQNVNGQPYVKRWYEITPTSNGPADVILYLTLDDFTTYNASPLASGWPLLPTTGNSADPNIPNIRITKNDAGVLSVITPTTIWDATNNRFELSFSVTGFSQFRVHSVNNFNAPLPVNFKSFYVKKESNTSILYWTTSTEENNIGFDIERSSSQTNFEKIGFEKSKATNGNSNEDLSYKFIDEKPMHGNNYYRLLQKDIDGKENLSEVVLINFTEHGNQISLYPNPFENELNIEINSLNASNVIIKLSDLSGRTIQTLNTKTEIGQNKIPISLLKIASGIYQISIFENGKLSLTQKVTKR
ncbi:MAG: T9SS type A sorting domain-containing protein [Chitinophagaceae bacterium]|nr:T9SS type A sorting domain-containing protein [Chitinophagaceae bacterium]